MDRQAIISALKDIIGGYLAERGLELVDLVYHYEGRDLFLRILVDRPEGGISLGECATMNREIGNLLDEKDILREKYVLEVSSPGIDRPLISKNDFLRYVNRRIRLFLSDAVNGKIEWVGTIAKVEDESVYVNIEGETVEIPLAKINKAKQVID